MRLSGKKDLKQRVLQFELNPDKKQGIMLGCLTYAASKLWNVGNYERKCWTSDSGLPYPDWYEQKKRLKDHFWFRNLPSQTAQEVLKQLDESWQSYRQLRRTGGIQNPQPPGYRHSNCTMRYLNKGFTLAGNVLRLAIPKQQKTYIQEKHGIMADFLYIAIPDGYEIQGNVKVIEIKPISDTRRYKVGIIYELPRVEHKPEKEIQMGIDLGVDNIAACHTTTGKSLIISGRQLLSINRYYDKRIGYYQSIAYSQQAKSVGKHLGQTKRIRQLYRKRGKQVNHLLHTATHLIMRFAEQEGVSIIVIGDVTGIREEKNMGSVANQKFHKWPFKRITDLLTYKAEDLGIKVEKEDESYTSQCSPYADDISQKEACKENRKYRGLYVTNGKEYNADCVGAYNILKKYLRRNGNPIPAVVGLDNPMMYRWDSSRGFVSNQKLAISMAM